MSYALEHESTRNYIHHAAAASDPTRILSQGEEYRALIAWVAMQETTTNCEIPILRLTYSANRLIAKLLARAAQDHNLGWGAELMAAATERV